MSHQERESDERFVPEKVSYEWNVSGKMFRFGPIWLGFIYPWMHGAGNRRCPSSPPRSIARLWSHPAAGVFWSARSCPALSIVASDRGFQRSHLARIRHLANTFRYCIAGMTFTSFGGLYLICGSYTQSTATLTSFLLLLIAS